MSGVNALTTIGLILVYLAVIEMFWRDVQDRRGRYRFWGTNQVLWVLAVALFGAVLSIVGMVLGRIR